MCVHMDPLGVGGWENLHLWEQTVVYLSCVFRVCKMKKKASFCLLQARPFLVLRTID